MSTRTDAIVEWLGRRLTQSGARGFVGARPGAYATSGDPSERLILCCVAELGNLLALTGEECQKGELQMRLKPLGDRIVIRQIDAEDVTASGIVLPDTAQEKPQRGEVLAVGEGRYDDGVRVPLDLVAGDEVIYSKYGGTEVEIDGEDLLILRESDVLAKAVK